MGVRHVPLPAPMGRALRSLLTPPAHPLWCSQSCIVSQEMLPQVIAECFALDTANADGEMAVSLAAANSEGAEVRLPGHVL